MNNLFEALHDGYVKDYRVRVLSGQLGELLPGDCTVLDVGSGDGMLCQRIMASRPDVRIVGVDRLVREETCIPIRRFDGVRLPFPDRSFDVAMFVDVLHHTEEPMVLLREAQRVARRAIVVKDHLREGLAAERTLRFMDSVGNRRFAVELPFRYWSGEQWSSALRTLGLDIEEWRTRLNLYPWWLDWWFGRDLHFAARLATSAA